MATERDLAERIILEGWNRRQFEGFESFFPEEIAFHYREYTRLTNLEGLISAVSAWKLAFPDFAFEIVHLLVEKEMVAVNLTMSGTHQGPWKDLAPTGRSVQANNVMFFRFDSGHLAEVWEIFDEFALRAQLSGTLE